MKKTVVTNDAVHCGAKYMYQIHFVIRIRFPHNSKTKID